MTPEELRLQITDGISRALNSRIARRFMSDEDAKLLKAERSFWQAADGATLRRLLDLFDKE